MIDTAGIWIYTFFVANWTNWFHHVIFLIGGGLFRHSHDLIANCRYFRQMVDNF